MTSVSTAIGAFRNQPSPPESASNPFKLSSFVDEPASLAEIHKAWPDYPLPEQLVEAWTTARQARLFADVDYGQWGLVLLPPNESAQRTEKERSARSGEYRPGDVVVGEFLGDQELLVLEGGSARVLIALPLYDRSDWFIVAENLGQFLASYFDHGGEKFWEQRSGN